MIEDNIPMLGLGNTGLGAEEERRVLGRTVEELQTEKVDGIMHVQWHELGCHCLTQLLAPLTRVKLNELSTCGI